MSLTRRQQQDIKILAKFIHVYCRSHHRLGTDRFCLRSSLVKISPRNDFCPECLELLEYAIAKRMKCPLADKPACKHCQIHCYRAGMREKIREIMRFSGKKLVLRGRLDLLLHYLL